MILPEEKPKLISTLTKLCIRTKHPFIKWRFDRPGNLRNKSKDFPDFILKFFVTQDGWDENFTGKPEDDADWIKVQMFPMFEVFVRKAVQATANLDLTNYPEGIMYQYMEAPENLIKRSKRNVLIYEGYAYLETEVPNSIRQREMERRRGMSDNDKRREAELLRRFRQSQRKPKRDSGLFID